MAKKTRTERLMAKSKAAKLSASAQRAVQKRLATSEFRKGIWPYFARDPIGTLLGIAMLYISLYWCSLPVGPFAGDTDLQKDFATLYTNTTWIGLVSVVLVFVAAPMFMVLRDGVPRMSREEPEPIEPQGEVAA